MNATGSTSVRVPAKSYGMVVELIDKLGLHRTSIGTSILPSALRRLIATGLLGKGDHLVLEVFIKRCNGRIGPAIRYCERGYPVDW